MQTRPRQRRSLPTDGISKPVVRVGERYMLRVSDLAESHVERLRITRRAVSDEFAHDYDLSPSLGVLIDVRRVRALLTAVGLEHVAENILGRSAHRLEAAPAITPENVTRFFDMVRLGIAQEQAAVACGFSSSTASRLRRGLLNDTLSPEALAAWRATFGALATAEAADGATSEDAADRTEHRADARDAIVDERNAALIFALFRLVKLGGMRPSEAARQLQISKSHAVKLLNGTYPAAGPKTRQAWQTWLR